MFKGFTGDFVRRKSSGAASHGGERLEWTQSGKISNMLTFRHGAG